MPFDQKEFLKTLGELRQPPTGSSNDFASYLAGQPGWAKQDVTNLGIASQANEDTRGVFSKAMGWLGSLGTMTENVFLDAALQERNGYGWGEALKKAGRDVVAGVSTALQPVIDLGPIDTPWDKAVSGFNYKYNTQHEGQFATSGAAILDLAGVKNKVAKYGGGFGIDVLTDPLTYVGAGAARVLKAPKVLEEIAAGGTQVEKAATGASDAVRAGVEAAKSTNSTSFLGSAVADTVPSISRNALEGVKPLTTLDVSRATRLAKEKPKFELPSSIKSEIELNPFSKTSRIGKKAVRAKIDPTQTTRMLNELGIGKRAVLRNAALNGELPAVAGVVEAAIGTAAEKAVKVAEAAKTAIAKEGFTPKAQANLYNRMYAETAKLPEISKKFKGLHDSESAKAWRRSAAIGMVKAAEDHLASQGIHGITLGGNKLALTDVVAELGKESLNDYIPRVMEAFKSGNLDKITNTRVREAIDTALARREAQVGHTAKTIYDQFAKRSELAAQSTTGQNYAQWLKNAPAVVKELSTKMGFTEAEANKIADLAKQHMNIEDLANMEPYHIVELLGPDLSKAFLAGKVSAKELNRVGKSITKQLGYKPGELSLDRLQNGVTEWMGHNLSTWYGRGSMMHALRSGQSIALLHAKARAGWIGRMMHDYSPDEINKAFARAQKPLAHLEGDVFGPKVEALAGEFKNYWDELFGKTSLGLEGRLGIAAKSQMTMETINHHLKALKSPFRFTEKKGGTWWESWRDVNPASINQNPAIFMYNMDLAVQRTLAEFDLVDMFRTEFGKAAGETGFDALRHTHEMPHARIDPSVKFHPDVAREFQNLLNDFYKGQWSPGSKLTQFMSTSLRKWKSSVTIYYPAHHVRNLVGDSWLMWTAGYNDPRVFTKALKILGSQRKRYDEVLNGGSLADIQKFLDPSARGWLQTEGHHMAVNKYGAGITSDELYGELYSRGLLVDASRIEDLQGDTLASFKNYTNPVLSRLNKPFGGAVHSKFSNVSEMREHYIRIAHGIAYAEKHMSRDLGKALAKETSPVARAALMKDFFDKAAMEIRKYHPDGTDMSFFEQKYLRNIIPFYAWIRKAIPLTMEAMYLHPAKVTAYPRAMYAMQGALGINAPGGVSDPFPTDQMFPDWIQGAGIGPMGDPESNNPFSRFFGKLGQNEITPFGQERGYTVVNPGKGAIPTDMIQQFLGMGTPGDVKHGLLDVLTPFFSVPANIYSGTTNTGRPMQNASDYLQYALSTIPQTTPFERTFQWGHTGQDNIEPGMNQEALINMLTGLGITGTGKYIKTAELQARDRNK